MPGMVLFGRRWAIASDDLVFPGFFELVVRVLWWIGILTLYLMHRGKLDCAGGALLSSYLIVLMILLAVVICTVSAIMCVSMRGHRSGAQRHCGGPRPASSATGQYQEQPRACPGGLPCPRELPAAEAEPQTMTWSEAISSTVTSAPSCTPQGCSTGTSSTSASMTRFTSCRF
ncbi:diacylglycerol lipase beta [Homo sapiens]|uniref:Diacylglycerol lipase beta n=1 Tax=Homo sapiens TaxID=9606 RepID=F8WBN0_HUMAN|nr:diacylglycerol lipase beta [Homo sapiens]KAI4012861.1 diacylglycerol lipase beta [Homo sapiens]